jgi:hypothetical protein
MKQFFTTLLGKVTLLLQQDTATRDRSPIFQLVTLSLLSGTTIYIIYYTLKNIG